MNQNTAATTDIRRFGYYIPQPDGTVDSVVCAEVAGADVLAELHEIVSVVFDLQPIIFAFNVIERNHRELVDSIKDYRSQLGHLAPSMLVPISTVMDGLISVSQKVNNFLSSASAFLAQTATELRRVHGKDSPALTTWNKKLSNLHSTYFSYRFLYELRNFA
jgi:hypothetical protein